MRMSGRLFDYLMNFSFFIYVCATSLAMPVISILRSCRPKLKCLVVLIALAVAAASLLVLVFQPLPVNVHHLLAWENCPNDSGQQAVGVALSLKSADDAGTTRAATDLGTSTTTTNYRNTSGVLSTSNWGNSRAVCVGSNASLGEVEDLLCLVSSFLRCFFRSVAPSTS